MQTKSIARILSLLLMCLAVFSANPLQAGSGSSPNSGLFEPYITFPTGGWPEAVAIGDVNHDNRNDVVMTTSMSTPGVHVFLQNKAGGLDPHVTYPASNGSSIDIDDVNNDGLADVVITSGKGIGVFLQNKGGGLDPMKEYGTIRDLRLRIGDFNSDGLNDVVSMGWSEGDVDVFYQNPNGTLDNPITYPVTYHGYNDLEVGDVNNDGMTDIIVMSGQGGPNGFGVLIQKSGGGFAAPEYYSSSLAGANGVAVGDVNDDALQDVVMTCGGNKPNAYIEVFLQNASGTLDSPTAHASYDIPEPVEIADVNNDGMCDVVALNGGWNAMEVYLQDNDHTLKPYELYDLPYASHYNPHGLDLGDINGDGLPDAVAADYNHGLVVLYHVDMIIYVPDDYPTIQDAIAAAAGGYTVIVRPDSVHGGPYVENIDFQGKAVIVKSEKGPEVTTIDGGLSGSVAKFVCGEGPDSVLEGFTLTNGSGTLDYNWTYGGAVFCNNQSSPSILKNIITSNRAFYGAGIACMDLSSPLIEDNLIAGNKTEDKGYGGGIACRQHSSPVIHGNVIGKNAAGYHGGGIYCSVSGPSIVNSIVAGNEAWWGGGVFYTGGEYEPGITNSTIVVNKAGWAGGGIHCWYSVFPVVLNTILWGNTAQEGKEVFLGNHISPPATLTVDYSDMEGGKSSVHLEPGCALKWGQDMIDMDPLFENPGAGDYHLSWLSPCINRGTNEEAPGDDVDGDPRPYMGTAEMGADEFVGLHSMEVDLFEVSASSGGVMHFALNGGVENAGRNYLIYGSISGASPGTPLPGEAHTLPINWDLFTNIVANVNYPNSVLFENFFGTLDHNGQMHAVFNTNGPTPGMAGYVMTYAFPLQGPPWDFVSNPVNIGVVE